MKWGIIATGNIAKKFAKTVSDMEGEELAAVGSRDKGRAEAFAADYGIPRVYGSYKELADDAGIDAVYIAVPNNFHYENTLMCLEAGKHVLCEKPFTVCANEAERLYKFAKEKGLLLTEGLWIRFLPLYQKLLEIIRSEEYGKLRHARCEYGFTVSGERRERKFKSELAGGALLDIGIYCLGFLRMVMGENPKKFTASMRFNEYGTDEFSAVQLEYPNGATAQCVQTIGLQIDRKAALFFDSAAVYLDDFQGAYSMTIKRSDASVSELKFPPEINGFEYQIRDFSKCVSQGKTESSVYTHAESLDNMRLLDSIRSSCGLKFSFE